MIRVPHPLKRAILLAVAAFLAGAPAEAYYHYVCYLRYGAPYSSDVLVPARFDLSRLPNNTVTFYVNDSGPGSYSVNDSFGSVLSEVKQALAAWNAVPTSALRISFGGIQNPNQNANTPGGQVIFQDLPPGILGYGTPQLQAVPNINSNAQGFLIPINHSLVILTNNTSAVPGPSYLESFFTTAVHEIGHALGLQHTWTGSAMSQGVIRNTSRARPLDADDIASISDLYGAPGWNAAYGSISGTVQFTNNQPVSLASVVAISATGPAISALTNPNGTYTINGLPPGSYQLYIHPLPPDGVVPGGEGLQLPQNQGGVSIPASGPFRSFFYPGTLDPNQARTFNVTAGSSFNADFNVSPRNSVPAYDLITYSYLDPGARNYTETPPSAYLSPTPAFVNSTQPQVLVYAVANQGPTAPVSSVTMLGVAAANVQTNSSPGMFLYFNMPATPSTGPRHLVFNYGNDMYVLPNAVNLVQQGPPSVASVISNGDGTVTIAGSNFGLDSRVFFDGLPALGTYNASQSSITVTPPTGASGQVSTITVFQSDSQNSMLLQQQNPQTYTYPSYLSPQIQTVNPSSLPSGIPGVPYTAMVDITGTNTRFADGQVTVGFGSSDISVNRVWVLNPTHLIANVVVAPGAVLGFSEISVISGFNVMTAPSPFQITPANPSLPVIGTIVNPVSGQTTLNPGGFGVIYGAVPAVNPGSVQVTLNGTPLAIQFAGINQTWYQVNFLVPSNASTGGAVLTLSTGSGSTTMGVSVGNPPVAIQGIANPSGTVDAGHFANPGDILTVQVNNLDPSVVSNPARLQVTVAGFPMPVTQVSSGQVQFVLNQAFGGAQVPVVVLVDGSPSAAFVIAAR